MPEWEEDVVVGYINSQIVPEPTDLTRWENGSLFDNDQWMEELFEPVSIQKFSAAQKMKHKYHQTEEEVMLPPEYNSWKKVFEKEASERFPEHHP